MIFSSSRSDVRNLQILAFGLLILWGLTSQIVFLTGFPLLFALLGYDVASQIREARETSVILNPLERVLNTAWSFFSHVHIVVGFTLVWIIARVSEQRDSWLSSAFSMSTGLGNWAQITRPENYFGFDSQTSPFIHLWLVNALFQLALIFIAIGFLVSLIRFEVPTQVGRLVSVALILFAGYLLLGFRSDFVFTSEFFLSTWTWLWSALLGFAIGFIGVRLPESRTFSILSDAGIFSFFALLVIGYFDVSIVGSHYLYLVVLLIALLQLSSRNATITYSLLSSDIASKFARLSFGAFLWHWPIAQLIKRELGTEAFSILEAIGVLIASFVLSFVTSFILDRVSAAIANLGGLRQWSAKVAALALLPLVLFFIQSPTSEEAGPNPTPTVVFTPSIAEAENDVPEYLNDPKCAKNATTCVFGDKKSDIHVVLYGNSLAGNWQPALSNIAIDKGWKLEVRIHPECPAAEESTKCQRVLSQLEKYVLQVKPDLVLTNFNIMATSGSTGNAQMQSNEMITPDVTIFEKLIKAKIKVVLLRGPSQAPDNPLECLKNAADFVRDCLFSRVNSYLSGDALDRALVFMTTGVEIIDLTDEFCVQEMCYVAKPDGEIIYRTSTLITRTYSLSLASVLSEKIQIVLDSPISTRPFNCKPGDRRPECDEASPSQIPSN